MLNYSLQKITTRFLSMLKKKSVSNGISNHDECQMALRGFCQGNDSSVASVIISPEFVLRVAQSR